MVLVTTCRPEVTPLGKRGGNQKNVEDLASVLAPGAIKMQRWELMFRKIVVLTIGGI